MNDPWACFKYGQRVRFVDVNSRLRRVEEADERKLREMFDWPDTQKTVRLAVERRLKRIITKEKNE